MKNPLNQQTSNSWHQTYFALKKPSMYIKEHGKWTTGTRAGKEMDDKLEKCQPCISQQLLIQREAWTAKVQRLKV